MIYLELFWTFFKIGLFTFGGGYAMLPLIQSEVTAHHWMETADIVDFIAVSESTPGPLAVNMATFTGMVTGGPAGAACATLGVVLPSFLVILAVAAMYERFRRSRLVEGAMAGLRPAVIGLIAAALLSLGKSVFFPSGISAQALMPVPPSLAVSLGIFAAAAVLAFRKIHPIAIIGLSAAAGLAAGYWLKLPV